MIRITRAWGEKLFLRDEDGTHIATITVKENPQARPGWDAVALELEVPAHVNVFREDRKFFDGRTD